MTHDTTSPLSLTLLNSRRCNNDLDNGETKLTASHKSQIYHGMVKKLITTYLLLLIGLLPACTKLKEVGNNAIRPTLCP